MTTKFQNVRHSIVPPSETIHQLNFNHADTLDNPCVGLLTENHQTVAEMPPRWNFDNILWNIIEIIAALCSAVVFGVTLFAFFMWVLR